MQGTQFGKSLFFSPVPPLNTCVSVCQWSGRKGGSHTWQTAAYQQYTTLQQAWLLVQSPKEVRTQWYVLVSQLESIILLFVMHLKFAFLCTCFNRSRKTGNSTARWNDLFWQAELGLSTSYTFFFAPSKYKILDTHLYSEVHILSTILHKFHFKKYMQKCTRRYVCSKRPKNNFNPSFL